MVLIAFFCFRACFRLYKWRQVSFRCSLFRVLLNGPAATGARTLKEHDLLLHAHSFNDKRNGHPLLLAGTILLSISTTLFFVSIWEALGHEKKRIGPSRTVIDKRGRGRLWRTLDFLVKLWDVEPCFLKRNQGTPIAQPATTVWRFRKH